MGERVIADQISLIIDTFNERHITLGLQTDNKESSINMIFLKDIQDLRCPSAIRTVVEGKQQFFVSCLAILHNLIGRRYLDVFLFSNESFVIIHHKLYLTVLRGLRSEEHTSELQSP